MVEPATITLSAIGLFVKIVDKCGDVVTAYETFSRLPNDILDLALDLALLHAHFRSLIFDQPVIREKLLEVQNGEAIRRKSLRVQSYFEACEELLKKYGLEGPSITTSSSLPQLLATTEASTSGDRIGSSASIRPAGRTEYSTPQARKKQISRISELSKKIFSKRKAKADLTDEHQHQNQDSNSAYLNPSTTAPAIVVTDTENELLRKTMASEVHLVGKKNIFRRVPWTMYEKKKLIDSIAKIRIANNDLDTALRRIAPRPTDWNLPKSAEVDQNLIKFGHEKIAHFLFELHQSLVRANFNGQKSFHLTWKLLENHELSHQDLIDYLIGADFEASQSSYVFNFRRHFSETFDDIGSFLIIEDAQIPGSHKDNAINRLDEPPSSEHIQRWNGLDRWGGLKVRGTDSYVVYSSPNSNQYCPITLTDLLQDEKYKTRMLPTHTMQLSRLLLCTYLYLSHYSRKSSTIHPGDIRYYREKEEPISWNEKNPLVLSPWLAAGIGSRPGEASLGTRSGTTSSQDYLVARLGILMFQLGTGVSLDYTQAISTLKDLALSGMNQLRARMSLPYTELVRRLLEYVDVPKHLASDDSRKEMFTLVQNGISTLYALEAEAEGTISQSLNEQEAIEATMPLVSADEVEAKLMLESISSLPSLQTDLESVATGAQSTKVPIVNPVEPIFPKVPTYLPGISVRRASSVASSEKVLARREAVLES